MRRVAPTLAPLLMLIAVPALVGAELWDFIRGKRELEVITVTEVSSLNALRPVATPNQPQYYVALSFGYRELGGSRAGTEEPPPKEVIHLISSELAKQGFLPATPHTERPSLVLAYTWGTLNTERFYGADPSAPPTILNRAQIVSFLGGNKVGVDRDHFNPLTTPALGLSTYSYEARSLFEVAREDFYAIVVSAYDLEAALQQKHLPPLWTTRIAAPSLGFDLGDVLPAMLAIGGQQFGRDTPHPVWVNASDEFTPEVRLGELQLLETLKDNELPVIDSSGIPNPKK